MGSHFWENGGLYSGCALIALGRTLSLSAGCFSAASPTGDAGIDAGSDPSGDMGAPTKQDVATDAPDSEDVPASEASTCADPVTLSPAVGD